MQLPRDIINTVLKYLPVAQLQNYQLATEGKNKRKLIDSSLWIIKCRNLGLSEEQIDEWYLKILANNSKLSVGTLCLKLCSWFGDIGQNSHLFINLDFCISYAYNAKNYGLLKYFCNRITDESSVNLITSDLNDAYGLAIIVAALSDRQLFLPIFEHTVVNNEVKAFLLRWYARRQKDFDGGNMNKYISYAKLNDNSVQFFADLDEVQVYVKYNQTNPGVIHKCLSDCNHNTQGTLAYAMILYNVPLPQNSKNLACTIISTALSLIKPKVFAEYVTRIYIGDLQTVLNSITIDINVINNKTLVDAIEIKELLILLPVNASCYLDQLSCLFQDETVIDPMNHYPHVLLYMKRLALSCANLQKLTMLGHNGINTVPVLHLTTSTIHYDIEGMIFATSNSGLAVTILKQYFTDLWQAGAHFEIVRVYRAIVTKLLESGDLDTMAALIDSYGLWPGFVEDNRLNNILYKRNPLEITGYSKMLAGAQSRAWPELAYMLKLDANQLTPRNYSTACDMKKYFPDFDYNMNMFKAKEDAFMIELKYLLGKF